MKTHLLAKYPWLAALLLLANLAPAPAADRYSFTFSVTGKTTNELGALVKVSANSSGILREVSEDTGIPTSALAVSYERSSGLVRVVDRQFGTNITTVVRLMTNLTVANNNLTMAEMSLELDHPDEPNFHGSAVASIRIGRDATGAETSFKLNGKMFVAIDETSEDPAQVYTGVFSTGSAFTPRQ